MKNKVNKGNYFYLKKKRKQELFKTILFFGISASIFLAGYLVTQTKANYLTIVAILGCLPASKSAVSTIMYFRIKECSKDFFTLFQKKFGNIGSFHLLFTSYDKNFPTSHLFVKNLGIIAYSEGKDTDAKAFEEHIKTIINREGIKNVHVKLFKEKEKYLQRMEQMVTTEHENEKDVQILRTLHSVSL